MPRLIGRPDAYLLGAALGVLEAAANRSRGQAVTTLEVRLGLLVVHSYARDRKCVRSFWNRASLGNRSVDDGLGEPLRFIRLRLVSAGWLTPSFLLDPLRTWPWDSPAPPGWLDPERPMDGGRGAGDGSRLAVFVRRTGGDAPRRRLAAPAIRMSGAPPRAAPIGMSLSFTGEPNERVMVMPLRCGPTPISSSLATPLLADRTSIIAFIIPQHQ